MLIKKQTVLVPLLFISMASTAQVENRIVKDSVSVVKANDSTITLEPISNFCYSDAYENALKRKDELTTRMKILNDSIKSRRKELKKLEGQNVSIVNSNETLEKDITQVKVKAQKLGYFKLLEKREQLLKAINENEIEIASLDLQIQEYDDTLNARNHQREDLGRIKDNVSNQIISENKDYLEKLFSHMKLSELRQIKSKCQIYTTDSKLKAFLWKVDVVIKNKELYDNMVNVVNASYKKSDVDRALVSFTQINGANMLQQKEISELRTQLSLYSDGLEAFKDFITELNRMRDGVNYSMEFFQTDCKQIMSKKDLGNRINDKLIRVPYLKKKYEEFMTEFKKNPNKHSEVEKEILGL